ncbi:MAG: glycosyltransferase family 2 protein [Candidatus Methylomirabilales bacterium]
MAGQPTDVLQSRFDPGVAICIPVYNEEQTIEQVVYEADETLQKAGIPGELLVLDDCSRDRSWEILQRVQKDLLRLQLRRHDVNQGIAATCNELCQWAGRELVFLNSADRQWKMSILLDMLPLMHRYDLIVARRKVKHYSFSRHLASWGFNALPVMLFGTHTYDAGSVKLVRRKIYDIPVTSSGVFVEAERIVRASRRGYHIGFIDVDHFPRGAGKASGASLALVMQSLVDLVRCWIDITLLRRS